MAKATTPRKKPAAKKPATKAPNLFARAKSASDAKVVPKNKKGTTLALPVAPLDGDGKVSGENAKLHVALSALVVAKSEEKTAVNKGNACKGMLKPTVEAAWIAEMAKSGVLPDTPVSITNYKGESVTWVIVDKSKQYDLGEDQVTALIDLLGPETADKCVVERTIFGFDPATMEEAVEDATVADVVGELLSEAIGGCDRLTDEQKTSLLTATSKTHLRPNTLRRIPELIGSDVSRIASFFAACGSSITRYFKV